MNIRPSSRKNHKITELREFRCFDRNPGNKTIPLFGSGTVHMKIWTVKYGTVSMKIRKFALPAGKIIN